MKIAFIGLGNMGSGMCLNLVKNGLDVSAFDLSDAAVAAMADAGARPAPSIADCARGADAVITMLPAGKHVHDVYFGEDGVTGSAKSNAIFLDCSTISVEDARRAADLASAAGFSMVDAPVSGGVAAAGAGTLTFMVGGTQTAFERAKPILDIMGKTVVHAGAAGTGQVAKIANNMLLGVSMIATCEAFNLAERLGMDAQSFFDIASKASGQNWSMTSYCPAPGPVPQAPSNNGYKPGFAVDMMLKDLRLAAAAAKSCDAQTRLGGQALEVYEYLSKNGYGSLDFSAVMKKIQNAL